MLVCISRGKEAQGLCCVCPAFHIVHKCFSCLQVEPPQPEEKLEMLTEIAQEYAVRACCMRLLACRQACVRGGAPGACNVPATGEAFMRDTRCMRHSCNQWAFRAHMTARPRGENPICDSHSKELHAHTGR